MRVFTFGFTGRCLDGKTGNFSRNNRKKMMTTPTETDNTVIENHSSHTHENELHALFQDTPLIEYADALFACGLTRDLVSKITAEYLSSAVCEDVRSTVKSMAHRHLLVSVGQRLRDEAAAAVLERGHARIDQNSGSSTSTVASKVSPTSEASASTSNAVVDVKFDFLTDSVANISSVLTTSVEDLWSAISRQLMACTAAKLRLILFHLARTRSLAVYRTGLSAENSVVADATAMRFRTVMRTWGMPHTTINALQRHGGGVHRHFVHNVLTHHNGIRIRDLQKEILLDKHTTARARQLGDLYAAVIRKMTASVSGQAPIYNPSTLRMRADWRTALVNEVAPALDVVGARLLAAFERDAMAMCDSIASVYGAHTGYVATHKTRYPRDAVLAEQSEDIFRHSKLCLDASDGECELFALKLYLKHCAPRDKNNVPVQTLAGTTADDDYWWCFPLTALTPYLSKSGHGSAVAEQQQADTNADGSGDESVGWMGEFAATANNKHKRTLEELSDSHQAESQPVMQRARAGGAANVKGGTGGSTNDNFGKSRLPNSASTDGDVNSPKKKVSSRPRSAVHSFSQR